MGTAEQSGLNQNILAKNRIVGSTTDPLGPHRPLQQSVILGQFGVARTAWISLEEQMRYYVGISTSMTSPAVPRTMVGRYLSNY